MIFDSEFRDGGEPVPEREVSSVQPADHGESGENGGRTQTFTCSCRPRRTFVEATRVGGWS